MAAKKMDLAIVLGGKPKGAPADGEKADTTGGGAVDAAQSVIDAIDMKDAGALAKALKAFMDLSDDDSAEGV